MEPVVPPAHRTYAALPLGWAALLLYLTLAPADRLPPQPKWELLSFDTFAHAAFFAVQAALAWFWLRRQSRWPRLAHYAAWAVFLGCTALGALIEALQIALPFNRHGEWSDLLSDSLGTAVALGLCCLVIPAFRGRGWLLGLLALIWANLPTSGQDMKRVHKTIEALAAPQMHGRGYVAQGEHLAAEYLRVQLRELKLQPLAPDYTQPFTLDVNTFPGEVWASYQLDGPGMNCTSSSIGKFIAAPNSGNGNVHGLIQYMDSTVLTDTLTWAWWQRQGLHDRVLWMSQKVANHLSALPMASQRNLDSAAAWVTIVPKLTASLASSQAPQPRVEVLVGTSPEFNGKDRYGDPVTITPENGRLLIRVHVDAQLRRNYLTQNLAAIIRGTTQPDSFLVISAHYDHLGMMGRKIYFPGANDNASGVAMLLELAAYYAKPENRPACSIVLLLFGAEEAGLIGSQYFVAHPLVPLKQIKFLINLDLLGTGEQGATVVNGKVFPAAFEQLTRINTANHYLPSLGARGKAANSDHYPFSEAGVPAFFLYTRGGSTAYHDINDRPEALSLVGFSGAFGLVRDFLNERGAK